MKLLKNRKKILAFSLLAIMILPTLLMISANGSGAYPANGKSWLSWSSYGYGWDEANPVVKNGENPNYVDGLFYMSGMVFLSQFQMSTEGQYHLNPTATWDLDAMHDNTHTVIYLLVEYDVCWLNDNNTLSRVHHSDYNNSHTGYNSIPSGIIGQNKFEYLHSYSNYDIANASSAYTEELNHSVRWVENFYINGSYSYNPAIPANFMNHRPVINIPILFNETWNLRMDWIDYDYTAPQVGETPLPLFKTVADHGGATVTLSDGTVVNGDGSIYQDRQQLDEILTEITDNSSLTIAQRNSLYAWNKIFNLRIESLNTSIYTDPHPLISSTDYNRVHAEAIDGIELARYYNLNATNSLLNNYSTEQAINNTINAWTSFEYANYQNAAGNFFKAAKIPLTNGQDPVLDSDEEALRNAIASEYEEYSEPVNLNNQSSPLTYDALGLTVEAYPEMQPNYLTAYDNVGNTFVSPNVIQTNQVLPTNNDMINYLIPIAACLFFAMAGAIAYDRHSFSKNIFLTTLATGIAIIVWIGAIPVFMLSICAIILGIMIFSGNDDDTGGDA